MLSQSLVQFVMTRFLCIIFFLPFSLEHEIYEGRDIFVFTVVPPADTLSTYSNMRTGHGVEIVPISLVSRYQRCLTLITEHNLVLSSYLWDLSWAVLVRPPGTLYNCYSSTSPPVKWGTGKSGRGWDCYEGHVCYCVMVHSTGCYSLDIKCPPNTNMEWSYQETVQAFLLVGFVCLYFNLF